MENCVVFVKSTKEKKRSKSVPPKEKASKVYVEDSDPDDNLLVIPSKHLPFINNFCYDTNTE